MDTVDITPVFGSYFARNRGPVPGDPTARQPPEYGVAASLTGSVIDLTLTFRSGAAYCCFEWGCHARLLNGKTWQVLRDEMIAHGLVPPPHLELRLEVVIEAGALSFDFSRPLSSPRGRGWYAFTPAEPARYKDHVREFDGPVSHSDDLLAGEPWA